MRLVEYLVRLSMGTTPSIVAQAARTEGSVGQRWIAVGIELALTIHDSRGLEIRSELPRRENHSDIHVVSIARLRPAGKIERAAPRRSTFLARAAPRCREANEDRESRRESRTRSLGGSFGRDQP